MILQTIIEYRQLYFEVMRRSGCDEPLAYAQVLADKECVVGGLWHTWSRLLGYLYEIPARLNDDAADMLLNLGMFIQVIDDIADLPVDYANATDNLMLAALREDPQEWQIAQAHLPGYPGKFIKWNWIRSATPVTFARMMALFEGCGAGVQKHRYTPAVADDVVGIIKNIYRLTF
jgi:hypothetical protein